MKINIKSKNATRRTIKLTSATNVKNKVKAEVKRAKYTGVIGRAVLLVSAAKGNAFRLADVSKEGFATLCQNNIGLKYDGAKIDLLADGSKRDKQTRLELGDYIAAKGERATVKVLTVAQAEKLASAKHKIERNGKEIILQTFGSTDKHYLASIEQFKTGTRHFFQLETERIGKVNAKHYGSLIS